jgi:hypothetical protein
MLRGCHVALLPGPAAASLRTGGEGEAGASKAKAEKEDWGVQAGLLGPCLPPYWDGVLGQNALHVCVGESPYCYILCSCWTDREEKNKPRVNGEMK